MSGALSPDRLQQRLAGVLGTTAVEPLADLELEGARPTTRVTPVSGETLAAALGVLHEARVPALVRGGGSRLGLGHPVPTAQVLLETRGLRFPPELDAEDGVAYLPAGASLSELREQVRKDGEGCWELPLDPPGEGTTLGGALASAALGPCFGAPRDGVLGLEVVLADGARTRCGGRVVKNVTGYDLAKLYLGSLGTLGVIEAAWVRLRPAPECRELWLVPGADPGEGLVAARRPGSRAVVWLDAEATASVPEPQVRSGGPSLWVELAGQPPTVETDRRFLQEEWGAQPVEEIDGSLAALRRGPRLGLRARLSCCPSQLGVAIRELEGARAAVWALPGHGLLYASFPLPEPEGEAGVERAFRALRRAARASEGRLRIEDAPCGVRAVRDVFDEPAAVLPLFGALKQQYDPRGILNPGRMAGRL